jgi:ABC-2 type transport system permease protein
MFERIRHMMRKEFTQIFRDPRMRGMVLFVPVVQVLVFGYAVTTDVRHVPLGVYDLANGPASRELVARFVQSGYFDVVGYVSTDRAARSLIDRGKALAVLRVDRDFENALRSGRPAPVQLILDGTDSNTAGIALNYGARIAAQFSRQVLFSQQVRQHGSMPDAGVDLEMRAWFNENLESRFYFVPGVIAMLVMLITLTLSSMGIVREKEIGTIEQIMVTPMSSLEFILGKTIPCAAIAFFDVILVTLVAVFWFDVPIRGHLVWLFLATVLYLMTSLGMGLFISTTARTQQQAMMSTFFFYLPAILLSGFVFPVDNMPEVVQWITVVNPLRHFLVIIRAIFLKGVGPSVLWPQMLALALIGTGALALAVSRFRKTLA